MSEDEIDELMIPEDEIEQTGAELIFLNSRAGRCLSETLNDMFMQGHLGLEHLQDIPLRFNESMRRSLAARESRAEPVKARAQLTEFRDLPSGGSWDCGPGNLFLQGDMEFPANKFEIKGTF